MPEGLQQGSSGELLQNRIDSCEDFRQAVDDAAQEIRYIWDEHASDDAEKHEHDDDAHGPSADCPDCASGKEKDEARETCSGIIEALSWEYE